MLERALRSNFMKGIGLLLIALGLVGMFASVNATQATSRTNQAYIREATCILSRPESEPREDAVKDCEQRVEQELHVNIKNYLRNAY